MSIYKGTQLISGVATPTEPTRNLGQKIESDFQLVDAGLHKPDGSLISGSGIYAPFVQAMASLSVSSPESFCTEQEWQTSVIVYGMCDKYVYNSTNNTVRLPKRSSTHGNLIDSYSSGANWYRIYSDGWCEQGGPWGTNTSNWATASATFLVPFLDTNFNLSVQGNWSEGNASGCSITARSTTGFTGTYANNQYAIMPSYWQACGYIDISTYQQKPLYEYIVIATKIKSETEVDFDNLATELQNKVDKASLVEIPAIIETYRNSTSWYRVYSDGWCEQGGKCVTGTGIVTITLMKPYVDINYGIQITPIGDNTNPQYWARAVVNPQTTSFQTNQYDNYFVPFYWSTCGYIS